MMRTLLIDNYDSFTYNLYQLLAVVNGNSPLVIPNDCKDWDRLPLDRFDNVVISPGPGHPENQRDFGISLCAIHECSLPILGVCLGHQGICYAFGGRVDLAPEPVHGRLSSIFHGGSDIFEGVPSPCSVVRYHSLIASSLPDCLRQIAWTEDGLCMALRHACRPIWGVQFHPESIQSEHGRRILENFRDITAALRPRSVSLRGQRYTKPDRSTPQASFPTPSGADSSWSMIVRRIPWQLDAENVFAHLFSGSRNSFWLDSSSVIPGISRFSFMGDDSGPHAERIAYDVAAKRVVVERGRTSSSFEGTIFSYLDREQSQRRFEAHPSGLPFTGGYVGFIGYEAKADCGGDRVHSSPTSDAMFLFADRLIAFDHQQGCAYAIALCNDSTRLSSEEWLETILEKLARVPSPASLPTTAAASPRLKLRHLPREYLQLIDMCQDKIRQGESYEICLTNMITADAIPDPLTAYRVLRRRNPAPYAAFLRFGDLSILSASPERFLLIDADRHVESKPIKGTRRRGGTEAEDEELRSALATSEKDRSENLMIVDLVRNDLGNVCEPGSVHVPKLFNVESYATVHQLVSTIRGRLREGLSPIACVKAAFPGGSMTGAPKKRTMEILDKLENGPRGIYSGTLGYFGVTGQTDLSIVIRTLIATPTQVTFGVGGAIVALSDPKDELAETWVKARGLLDALAVASRRASRVAVAKL